MPADKMGERLAAFARGSTVERERIAAATRPSIDSCEAASGTISANTRARAAVSIGMAVNELATNWVKYGALSTATGRVQVSWMQPSGTQRLELRWIERDGQSLPR